MHIGLISLLAVYPIKYLIAFFVPYDSFSETNILFTSMSSIEQFFIFIRITFFDLFIVKIYALSAHSYIQQSKFLIILQKYSFICKKVTYISYGTFFYKSKLLKIKYFFLTYLFMVKKMDIHKNGRI